MDGEGVGHGAQGATRVEIADLLSLNGGCKVGPTRADRYPAKRNRAASFGHCTTVFDAFFKLACNAVEASAAELRDSYEACEAIHLQNDAARIIRARQPFSDVRDNFRTKRVMLPAAQNNHGQQQGAWAKADGAAGAMRRDRSKRAAAHAPNRASG